MRTLLALCAPSLVALSGCTHTPTGGAPPDAGAATRASAVTSELADAPATAVDDPCGAKALHLEPAKPADRWQIPIGCVRAPGEQRGPRVQSEAEFKGAFTCPAGLASGVDWSKVQLVVTTQTLSPAGVGWSVFDDGHALTIVSRFRKNCPSDPMPMPISVPVVIAIPAGGPMRELKSATCTIDAACP
jgi:hypothetical protein